MIDLIKQNKSGYISKLDLLKYLSHARDEGDDDDYHSDFADNFDWIIGWGRVALLIDYNANNESIRLRSEVEHNE